MLQINTRTNNTAELLDIEEAEAIVTGHLASSSFDEARLAAENTKPPYTACDAVRRFVLRARIDRKEGVERSSIELMERAVESCRRGLRLVGECGPVMTAIVQHNLAHALLEVGSRSGDDELLWEAQGLLEEAMELNGMTFRYAGLTRNGVLLSRVLGNL